MTRASTRIGPVEFAVSAPWSGGGIDPKAPKAEVSIKVGESEPTKFQATYEELKAMADVVSLAMGRL